MSKRKDIPFSNDASKFFLPWMSLLMVFIAVLAITGGFKIQNMLDAWRVGVSGSMTVQIPAYDDKGQSREVELKAEIEQTLTVLRGAEGIMGAEVVSDERMAMLMEPWMGGKLDVTLLPIPKLIDVSVDADNLPDLTALKTQLAKEVPAASLDSHRVWLDGMLKIVNAVAQLISFILILLLLTATFTVVYSTNASLAAQREVISLIHMIGAGDFYIARQYAWRNLKLVVAGGIIGLLAAVALVFLISYFTQHLFIDFYPQTGLTFKQGLMIAVIPFFLGALAFVTTSVTVTRYLRRFL